MPLDPELLKLFNELDADGRGIVEIRALAHKVLEHRRYAALFTLPSAYAQSDPAGHPPWLEKQGLYWLDLYHPFTWAELWRGIPFFQCGIASRMMEYLLDHVLLYQLAHGVECYWFAGNTACASSRATAEFVGRETITTVGYGHLGPDRWGGDEGFCHKPSSRAEYLALRDARLAMLNIMFEWKMWKSEWADNID